MAKSKHSSDKKTRNSNPGPASLTQRTEWACWMNGADPEWLSSNQAQRLAHVFRDGLPQWLVQSAPWRSVTGEKFKVLRKDLLRLDLAQCAAYLGTTQATITRWETNVTPVPLAAFEALRLQSASAYGRLSHRKWDGWFINPLSGEFVSPDVGNLAFGPAELNSVPMLHAERDMWKRLATEREQRVSQLEAENASMRSGQKVKAVARELDAMQAHISRLLADIHTADVLPFPSPTETAEKPLRKVAAS